MPFSRSFPHTCSLSPRILAVVAAFAIGAPILVAHPNGDLDDSNSALKPLITKYAADRTSLAQMFDDPFSEVRRARFRKFYGEWQNKLEKVDFDKLDQESRADYILFQNQLRERLRDLTTREKEQGEIWPLIPFARTIIDLDESRRRMDTPKAEDAARSLAEMVKTIAKTRAAAEAGLGENAGAKSATASPTSTSAGTSEEAKPIRVSRFEASRAASALPRLRDLLKRWFQSYNSYDPLFTWWVAEPYKEADQALDSYEIFVKEKLVGIKADDKTTIIGQPVGDAELHAELAAAMIPYSPQELIGLANNELAWCTREMLKASREMGFGDDCMPRWKKSKRCIRLRANSRRRSASWRWRESITSRRTTS
jgi:hypothetical protein